MISLLYTARSLVSHRLINRLLQEYTALAFIWAASTSSTEPSLESRLRGRVRILTRGVVFEPDDGGAVLRWPSRSSTRPCSLTTLAAKDFAALPDLTAAVVADGVKPRDAFAFQATSVVRAKAGGSAVPLETRSLVPVGGGGRSGGSTAVEGGAWLPSRATIVIALLHTPLGTALPTMQQLWEIQSQSPTGSRERAKLAPLLEARIAGPFDASLLSDYRERMLLPSAPFAVVVDRILPLVTVPGRFMLTPAGMYFLPVPVNAMAGSDPVHKWRLRDIARVQRRSRLQRALGLEITLQEGCAPDKLCAAAGLPPSSLAASRVFFAFSTPAARDGAYRILLSALRDRDRAAKGGIAPPSPASAFAGLKTAAASEQQGDFDDVLGDPSPAALSAITLAWSERRVSNFEYLMALNDAAGRTVSDFSQYPVLPWVIADYTSSTLDLDDPSTFRDLSLPIGALNPSRLAGFRSRYKEMPISPEAEAEGKDDRFLYGTHYSTPGYVLYFLARALPEHLLRLQAGRFDAPDRMFFDLGNTWKGVIGTNSDLKELIPEMYDSDGAFLRIPDGLSLGVRQSGRRVGDVGLPPWAYDAGDCVRQMRDALESDHVSAHLHSWIDLIFGVKQRAENNLFHPLTYPGAVDIEAMAADPDGCAAVQVQIAEFGQCPLQLFAEPHPARGEVRSALAQPAVAPSAAAPVPAPVKAPVPAPAATAARTAIVVDESTPTASVDESVSTAPAVSTVMDLESFASLAVPTLVKKKQKRVHAASHAGLPWVAGATVAPVQESGSEADRASIASGMAAVSCIVLGDDPLEGGAHEVWTAGVDGVVRLLTVDSTLGEQWALQGSCAPARVAPGTTGALRSPSLSYAALMGRDSHLPLRCATLIRGSATDAACPPLVAVGSIGGRVHFIARTHAAGISAVGEVAVCDAPLYALACVPLDAPCSALLLGGSADGSVHALTVQWSSHAPPTCGQPSCVSKRGESSITVLSALCSEGGSGGGRVAVGDSAGRVWTMDVDGSGSVRAYAAHRACESVVVDPSGRADLGFGGVSGVTSAAWARLSNPVVEGEEEGGEGGGSAPALLVTTSEGIVAVLYAPESVEDEADGCWSSVTPVLCGSLTTGEVLRCAGVDTGFAGGDLDGTVPVALTSADIAGKAEWPAEGSGAITAMALYVPNLCVAGTGAGALQTLSRR